MRIFHNIPEAVSEVKRDLAEMGIRKHPKTMQNKNVAYDDDYDTLELFGYSYMIEGCRHIPAQDYVTPILHGEHGIDGVDPSVVDYIAAEHVDRISGHPRNPGRSYVKRLDVWKEFQDECGCFDYTYSERMAGKVSAAIRVLDNDIDSRQAVIEIYESVKDDVLRGGRRRVPCSMHYQLLNTGQGLGMVYSMRSCDAFTHMTVDIVLAILLQHHVCRVLGKNVGPFVHQFGSLHAYRKDARETF